jgi:uncharacterized protein with ParB-like and HNH nuclease domain
MDDREVGEIIDEGGDNPLPYYINYSYSSSNLATFLDMINDGDIVVPEYQRNFVWKKDQADLLIDSVLRRIPLPAFILYKTKANEEKYEIVDGQQRLTSLYYFRQGYWPEKPQEISLEDYKKETANQNGETNTYKPFRLDSSSMDNEDKTKRVEWYGKTYQELSAELHKTMRTYTVNFLIIQNMEQDTNGANAILDLFERLNSGATPLHRNDIRMRLVSANVRTYFSTILKNETFIKLCGKDQSENKAHLLRLLKLLEHFDRDPSEALYRKITTLLDDFANNSERIETVIETVQKDKIFENSLQLLYKTFPDGNVFKRTENSKIHRVLFDVMMITAIQIVKKTFDDEKSKELLTKMKKSVETLKDKHRESILNKRSLVKADYVVYLKHISQAMTSW